MAAGKYYKPMIWIDLEKVKTKPNAAVPLARLARELAD